MRDYVRLTFRLTLICVVASVLLGATYASTKNTIAKREEEAATQARQTVLPSADSFEKMTADGLFDEYPMVTSVYAAKKDKEAAGFAVELTSKGYGGDMALSIGIAPDGSISGVRINTHTETAGLGAKCTEPEFYMQYDGKKVPLEVKKDIMPISGATITSRGVTNGVNTAVEMIEKYSASLTPAAE